MKIIISHDVDHLSVAEHCLKDFIIPKFIIWQFIEFIKSNIWITELFKRYYGLLSNKWNNIKQLQEFNLKNWIKTTYFFWVSNWLWLNYNQENAGNYIKYLLNNWADVWVHGINYDDIIKMEKEYNDFKTISWLNEFGIRMHYLRKSSNTKDYLSKLWYLFDCTDLLWDKYVKLNIWWMTVIPFQIMDWDLFNYNRNSFNLEEAKKYTKNLLSNAIQNNQEYFSILIHQRYFSDDFNNWKKWYIWFVNYCKINNHLLINYKELCKKT